VQISHINKVNANRWMSAAGRLVQIAVNDLTLITERASTLYSETDAGEEFRKLANWDTKSVNHTWRPRRGLWQVRTDGLGINSGVLTGAATCS